MRRPVRDGSRRVQELVRGDGRGRDPDAGAVEDDGHPESVRIVAAALAADVVLVRRAVVVHEVLRELRREPRLLQRVEDERETAVERRQLRARTRGADGRDVELRRTRERRHVVPRRARRVLAAPPGVDLVGVPLHQRGDGAEVVDPVGGDEVHPVDRVAGNDVGCAIGGGRGPAPGGSGGSRRGARANGLERRRAPERMRARMSGTCRRRDGAREHRDECASRGGSPHAVVTETRTLPRRPVWVTRTNIDRWPQIDPSRLFTR